MRRLLFVLLALVSGCEGRIGLPSSHHGGSPEPVKTPMPDPMTMPAPSCVGFCLGATALPRITAIEYQHSLLDVFGLAPAVDSLPGDGEIAGTFFSNDQTPVALGDVDLYRQTAEDFANVVVTQSSVLDRLLAGLPACNTRNAACADAFVASYGARLYRRPLTADEVDDYHALYAWTVKVATDPAFATGGSGTFADGIRYLTEKLLQSPGFLYRPELGSPTDDPLVVALTSREVAARLAGFLLRSVPDDELTAAAEADALTTPEQISAQVQRLTEGGAGDRLWGAFAREFISTSQIAESAAKENPDAQQHWSDPVALDLAADVEQTFAYLMRTDGRVSTLLTSSGGVVQGDDLKWIVGAGGTKGTWVASLPNRLGMLSWPGQLIANGHPGFTHAHQRGLWVRGKLLCQTIPSPPADLASAIAAAQQAEQNAPTAETDRDRMHGLTEVNAVCASCHHLTNPLGYGLDEYDELGRFRTTQLGVDGKTYPIDQSGELAGDGTLASDVNGAFTDGPQLINRLAGSATVAHCLERQVARFALGREMVEADQFSLDAAYATFDSSGRDLRQLVGSLAVSDAFRYRRLAQP